MSTLKVDTIKNVVESKTISVANLVDSTALSASSGSAVIGFVQAGVGAVARTAQAKMREDKSMYDYGGVPDYAGTPLYDGADAGRVTATDNTAAFQKLINAAIATGHDSVRIPAGHWGIKTGNLSFSNFNKLRIFGDGVDVTILDFFKEDATGASYVDNAQAQSIAAFATGDALEFADLTIKGTTKSGVVNGTSGPSNAAAVYYGTIWGFKINNVKDVRFTRVRVERFNYRGFSVYGSATERVTLLHCEGFNNVGSGFWAESAALVKVIGGEFAYNGIFGENGTGYGVTASSGVGKFLVKNVYCHHNYRKGIDSHGCGSFSVKNSTFENNILYHIANPNWSVPAGITDCAVVIKGNTFSNGKTADDKAWMKTCYDALYARGYGGQPNATATIIGVYDTLANGVVQNKIKSILIEDNTVICHYNGTDAGFSYCTVPIDVLSVTAEVTLKGNTFNFEHCAFPAGADVYSHILLNLSSPNVKLIGNTIRHLQSVAYTNAINGLPDYGCLMTLGTSGASQVLELHKNEFELEDHYFTAVTANGIRTPVSWSAAGASRVAINNNFSYTNDNFKGFTSLNDVYFLGSTGGSLVPLKMSNCNFIRNGVLYKIPDQGYNKTSSEQNYRFTLNAAIDANVFALILDKQYSTTIRITTNDGTPDLFIKIPFSNYAGITGSTTNGLFSYSAVDSAFVENGLTKLKITIKAKVALSGDYFGRIFVDGSNASLGLERVISV